MTGTRTMIVAAALVLASCSDRTSSSVAANPEATLRADRRPVYLALGDSVPFGWSNALADSSVPWRFVGYPQYLGFELGLRVLDAACPSEASGSFISADQPDDGCRAYRESHALHVDYPGTQLDYALAVVHDTPRLELVTLQLGANDLQLLAKGCLGDANCILAGLPATLESTATNLATIIGALRVVAGYTGRLVVVDYYNPTTDPTQEALIEALDGALQGAAAATGSDLVDLRVPFARAAARVGGDPCATGLIAKDNGTCEIHPSQLGHLFIATLIAREVERAR